MENEELSQVIDVFADDLFRYLLPRRINVFNCMPPVERSEDLPIVFHPHVGMAVLCESRRKQRTFISYFARHYPHFVSDTRSFFTFCLKYAVSLSLVCDDVRGAMLTIASMILELGVFCHIRDFPNFKYYAGICWSEIFKFYLAEEYFADYSWDDLTEFASNDAKAYIGGMYEVELGDGKVGLRNDWLRQYDYWISRFNPELEESVPPVDELPQEKPSSAEALVPKSFKEIVSTYKGENPLEGLEKLSSDAPSISSSKLESKPESESEFLMEMDRDLLLKFKSLLREEDSSCELLKILESEREICLLMNNDDFVESIRKTVEDDEDKMELRDVLELARIVLSGNTDLAKCLIDSVRYRRFALQKPTSSPVATELATQPDVPTPGASLASGTQSEILGAISGKTSFEDDEFLKTYPTLLEDFRRVVSACSDTAGSELCKIFDSEINVKFLMSDPAFRAVMELTVLCPVDRWGNEWLLLFTKDILSTMEWKTPDVVALSASNFLETLDFAVSKKRSSSADRDDYMCSPEAEGLRNLTAGASVDMFFDDLENPRGACSEPIRFYDPDSKVHVFDPADIPGKSEDVETVYVDIVDLRSSFNKLMMDMKKATKPDDLESVKEGATPEDQAKATSKRKRKNRRRGKRQESQSDESILAKSIFDLLKKSVSIPTGTGKTGDRETEDDQGDMSINPTSTKPHISNKLTKAFKRMVDQMPIPFSPEVSDWVLQQLMETNPEFLQSLKHKKDIDDVTVNEFMKYHDKFHKIQEETPSTTKSAATHSEGSPQSVAGACPIDKSYLY